jgi:lipopolysaccharide export system permease protein
MALLAVPFVITTLRGSSLGGRIVAGVLVGIGFQMFAHTFGRFGLVYGLAPFMSAIFPGALALALAVLWFTRAGW